MLRMDSSNRSGAKNERFVACVHVTCNHVKSENRKVVCCEDLCGSEILWCGLRVGAVLTILFAVTSMQASSVLTTTILIFVLSKVLRLRAVCGMTILFDIGNVLLRFDYKEALHALIPAELGDAAERLRLLDVKRDDLESGRISAEDFVDWSLATLGSPASADQFVAAWRSIFSPIDGTWALVEKWASAGHRLILFSNINPIHHPWIFEAYPVFRHFHGAVMSYEIGCMKPHDGFYETACERYALDPADTFYIDDLAANIAAGQRFGFHCHQYHPDEHEGLERAAAKLGLL